MLALVAAVLLAVVPASAAEPPPLPDLGTPAGDGPWVGSITTHELRVEPLFTETENTSLVTRADGSLGVTTAAGATAWDYEEREIDGRGCESIWKSRGTFGFDGIVLDIGHVAAGPGGGQWNISWSSTFDNMRYNRTLLQSGTVWDPFLFTCVPAVGTLVLGNAPICCGTYVRGPANAQALVGTESSLPGVTHTIQLRREPCDNSVDSDGDGLSDCREYDLGTNPNDPDTDGDGLSDGAEVDHHHTNPLKRDTDDGGVDDGTEVGAGTDPLDPSDDQPQGRIIIKKKTKPSGAPDFFNFTGAVTGSIADGQQLSSSVDPGTYFVTESATLGWTNTRVTCSDGDSSGEPLTSTATIVVDADETVTCTFTNEPSPLLAVDDKAAGKPGKTVEVPVLENDVGLAKVISAGAVSVSPPTSSGGVPGIVTISDSSVVFQPTLAYVGEVSIPYTIADRRDPSRTSTATIHLSYEDCATRTTVVAEGRSPGNARPSALRNTFTWCFDGTRIKSTDGDSISDANSQMDPQIYTPASIALAPFALSIPWREPTKNWAGQGIGVSPTGPQLWEVSATRWICADLGALTELVTEFGAKTFLKLLSKAVRKTVGEKAAELLLDGVGELMRAIETLNPLCLPNNDASINYYFQPDGHYTVAMKMKYRLGEHSFADASFYHSVGISRTMFGHDMRFAYDCYLYAKPECRRQKN